MDAGGSTDPTVGGSVISLPSGGGAVAGTGEKFAADPFTGSGAFSVPIQLPPGRAGLQPALSLGYSTGAGNGPFGLGWQLSVPGVTRKTSRGVPRYAPDAGPDAAPAPGGPAPDVFLLSGAEDLVPVAGSYPGRVRYRPRTEGLFARVEHVRDATGDYWEVRGREGTLTRYGTPRPAGAPDGWRDPAVLADPANPDRVFGWRCTETSDPLGNLIRYEYLRDAGDADGHRWDQPLLSRVAYADYGDRSDPSFLVSVEFDYEPRPDPCSDRRPGFEVRTTLRCRTIRVRTDAADGTARVSREYRLGYRPAGFNGTSLLSEVDIVGIDGATEEPLPPLSFTYGQFDPTGRRFRPVAGDGQPTRALSDPSLALVDLRGNGLPDVVELGAAQRFWRNVGGSFALPRTLRDAPSLALGAAGARFLDANGDGRADLLAPLPGTGGAPGGYFPMSFAGGWSSRSFQPYRQVPSVDLADPSVALVDLDGDGLTDVLRSGPRLRAWFNDADPRLAWLRSAPGGGSAPAVDLADPRIRLADMTGDGLPDIVFLHSGVVRYWPNLGHNRWGAPVTMRSAPRLPDGYDPHRLLLGDLDGDGAADLAYVADGRVLIWGNQAGNGWTPQPVTLAGTPDLPGDGTVTLSDLTGSGMAGLLYSRPADGSGRPHLWFLDLTGGVKPYLLGGLDNSQGASTVIRYAPSTAEFLRDEDDPVDRWRTTLPFPVQVVTSVTVTDAIAHSRFVTRYRYHHGYWDGVEREFRGFGMVERFDAETFDAGTAGPTDAPPTLTRNWFHLGPVAAAEAADWTELDLSDGYWPGDAPMLARPPELTAFLAGLTRPARRSALRALRGQLLRTELYALDGTGRADRPYTVAESLTGLRAEATPAGAEPVFFPFPLANRTSNWERGTEPMTRFAFSGGYDAYGLPTRQLSVAVPRGRDPLVADPTAAEPYLATLTTTEYAQRDDAGLYLVSRAARQDSGEVVNSGTDAVADLRATLVDGRPAGTDKLVLRTIGHVRTRYDGPAFTGLPLGQLGDHGLPVRTETLLFEDGFLDQLYPPNDPAAVSQRPVYLNPSGVTSWPPEYPQQFRDQLPAGAGYLHYGPGDAPGSPAGYYTLTARYSYDVHDPQRVPRGLVTAALDPLGDAGTIAYDPHDLLPVLSTDAAGLTTKAAYDYRLLQANAVTDPNGNLAALTFSPSGLITTRSVRGKDGTGDATEPTTTLAYDLLAYAERGTPLSIRTTHRVHHDTEPGVPPGQLDAVLVTTEFSDGFGRKVQVRSQAEDTLFGDARSGAGAVPVDQTVPVGATAGRTRAATDPANVIVSGAVVYDNKGRIVRRYEPYFDTGFDYLEPGGDRLGLSLAMSYDPRGELVRAVNPDGSEQLTVRGVPADLTDPDGYAPTPWETYTYDANDNAGRTHGSAAAGYQSHWNTPGSAVFDALGRAVRTVARNGATPDTWLVTASTYNIVGDLLTITDPLGRVAFHHTYDLGRRRWRSESIDGGRRDCVLDAAGETLETRDAKGALALGAFDALRRLVRLWARDAGDRPVALRQRLEYGDAGRPDQPAKDRSAALAANQLGRLVRHFDEAGLSTVDGYDFQGNVLRSGRRVIADAPILATYQHAAANKWVVVPFETDWTPAGNQTQDQRDATLLEATTYGVDATYDALNRVVARTLPADVTGHRAVLHATYNEAGGLTAVDIDGTPYVQRIAYDARNQRSLVAYGNGTMTRYGYDPLTLRLARLRTEHYTLTGTTYQPAPGVVQDYGYSYDLIGNVLTLHDRTPGSGIPGNPAALTATDPVLRALLGSGDALDRQFGYDPVYRLLVATGREGKPAATGDPWLDTPRGTDVTAVQAYREGYAYDAAGSLTELDHTSAGGTTRAFTLDPASNRLRRLTVGKTPYDYAYDPAGNLTGEGTSRHFAWNHTDRLKAYGTQTPLAEPSVHAQYLYDASGRRVKKLVRRQGGAVEVTHYPDPSFEHHRWTTASGTQPAGENNRVHVLDDRVRVALVRVGPAHPDDLGPAVGYELADHLRSCASTVDDKGALTNREEYTPYGETSFGSFTRKRYRFTGQERDEESGLAYHGVRYYLPWLGRFASPDPAGHPAGANLYAYAGGDPVKNIDTDGRNFTLTFDFTHNRITVSATYYVNTDSEKSELDAAVRTFNDSRFHYGPGSMEVRFELRVAQIPYPKDANGHYLSGTAYFGQQRHADPNANFFANASDTVAKQQWPEHYRSHDVGEMHPSGATEEYVGGQTFGSITSMNYHVRRGDVGAYIDADKHELAHTLGEHDIWEQDHHCFVRDGLSDYAKLTKLLNNDAIAGVDRAQLEQADVNTIIGCAVGRARAGGSPLIRFIDADVPGKVFYTAGAMLQDRHQRQDAAATAPGTTPAQPSAPQPAPAPAAPVPPPATVPIPIHH